MKNLLLLLPFLEEDELKELVKKIMDSPSKSYEGLTLTYLLPFLEDDYIDILFKELIEKNEDVSLFGPFLSEEALLETIEYSKEHPDFNLLPFIPFYNKQLIESLYEKVKNGEINISLQMLLPFIATDVIDKDFIESFHNHQPNKYLVPFVSSTCLHEIVVEYINGNDEMDIDFILPFLSKEDVKLIFNHIMI